MTKPLKRDAVARARAATKEPITKPKRRATKSRESESADPHPPQSQKRSATNMRKQRGTDGNNAIRGKGKSNRGSHRKLGDPFTGEPSDADIMILRNAAACGVSWGDVYMLFGVGFSTFKKWVAEYPALRDEYDHGLTKAGFEVGAALLRRAKTGDVTAIRYFERTRRGIRDDDLHVDVDVTHTVAAPPALTPTEWQKLYGPQGSETLVIEHEPDASDAG